MTTEFDKIYCINYLESVGRREFMQMQADELGLDITFYNALNYDRLFNDEIKSAIRHNTRLYNMAVYGCMHSHYAVLKEAQLLGYEKILIMEDDLCFIKDKSVIETYFNNLPEDADFIKYIFTITELPLFCPHHLQKLSVEYYRYMNTTDKYKDTPFISYKELPDWYPGTNCTALYAVNKKGIDYLVKCYEEGNCKYAADQFLYLFDMRGLDMNDCPINCYFTNKTIAAPAISFTTGYADIDTIPQINATPLFTFNKDDFYYNYFSSTICKGR